ncbi:hypothetical protein SADUNF_Sadunf16G0138500 [Salix dunnii]|uniref:Uncharacterized protein n=1 Tax=Salix dunnii TaxID=1413687 RepID=A0A835MGH3_9ROSI|nr:hypothetical protein SADUNF_Sadunf16G0138500 [Salix dunnii]
MNTINLHFLQSITTNFTQKLTIGHADKGCHFQFCSLENNHSLFPRFSLFFLDPELDDEDGAEEGLFGGSVSVENPRRLESN